MSPSPTATVPSRRRPFSVRPTRKRGDGLFAPKNEIKPIYWKDGSLFVLDQRELPHRRRYLRCADVRAVAAAIKNMALRGAPLIGGAAAYGYVLAAKALRPSNRSRWPELLHGAARE